LTDDCGGDADCLHGFGRFTQWLLMIHHAMCAWMCYNECLSF
jgi:hypothetical protein